MVPPRDILQVELKEKEKPLPLDDEDFNIHNFSLGSGSIKEKRAKLDKIVAGLVRDAKQQKNCLEVVKQIRLRR